MRELVKETRIQFSFFKRALKKTIHRPLYRIDHHLDASVDFNIDPGSLHEISEVGRLQGLGNPGVFALPLTYSVLM